MPEPILLIAFNRPSKTRILVDFFLQFEGLEIFVAADGWRRDDERALCEEVRKMIDELSARHVLHRRFSDRNLGCGTNVSTAINWVLSKRTSVIIIEDDVQVTPEFLDYCNENLIRFADDPSIACISGGPLVTLDPIEFPAPFLSRYPNIWGWATTQAAFSEYSIDLDGYSVGRIWTVLKRTFPQLSTRAYWLMLLLLVRSGRIDTWDFQYYFLTWAKNSRTLTPHRNLSQNIGFDSEGTHLKRAPKNVGVLDDSPDGRRWRGEIAAPQPSDRYDRLIERELYKISWTKVARFIVKYLITTPQRTR